MTPAQLKALAHLPAILDALEALAVETERLRALMGRAGGPAPQAAFGHPAAPTGAPPGVSYRQTSATSPPPDESPVKRERRLWLESMKGDARRQEKLAKFAHDGEPGDEVVTSTSELELSGSDG